MEVGSSAVSVTPEASPLGGGLLVVRRPVETDAHFDVTAMVDLVFMMNIFFLVTWVGASTAGPDLAAAPRHSKATDVEHATVVTIVAGSGGQPSSVYLGEMGSSPPLTDLEDAKKAVRAAAEAGLASGKNILLVNAEKNVKLREMAQVAGEAGLIEGINVRLGVMEKD